MGEGNCENEGLVGIRVLKHIQIREGGASRGQALRERLGEGVGAEEGEALEVQSADKHGDREGDEGNSDPSLDLIHHTLLLRVFVSPSLFTNSLPSTYIGI